MSANFRCGRDFTAKRITKFTRDILTDPSAAVVRKPLDGSWSICPRFLRRRWPSPRTFTWTVEMGQKLNFGTMNVDSRRGGEGRACSVGGWGWWGWAHALIALCWSRPSPRPGGWLGFSPAAPAPGGWLTWSWIGLESKERVNRSAVTDDRLRIEFGCFRSPLLGEQGAAQRRGKHQAKR